MEITERLEQRGQRVHLMPFGWHKDCHTEAVVGPGARQIIWLRRMATFPCLRGFAACTHWPIGCAVGAV